MIEPVVSESEWLDVLHGLPLWEVPAKPVLVIAPHPDDETLGAGGLIAGHRSRGLDVIVAAVTDGEKAFPESIGLAAARRLEQTKALRHLGVAEDNIKRLGLPDSAVADYEQELFEQLLPLVTEKTLVVAPWRGDYHSDHGACGRVAELLVSQRGATLASYFFWTWHLGTPDVMENLRLHSIILTPELLQAKAEALRFHDSQLGSKWGEPILPESLLGPARRPFEIFALP